MLLMLWTLIMTPFASADQGPFMWGVGPTISTVALPAQMPFNFPDEAETDKVNFKGTGGDVGFGVHAVMYMRHTQRFGTHMWYHTGANGYSSPNLTIEYDFVGSSANNVAFLGGLGGGFGSQSWKNDAGDKLSMNTFIARGQGSVNFRTHTNMFELAVFLNMFFPSGSVIEPAGNNDVGNGPGKEVDAAFVIYPQLGLEFTAYFGDFKPPRKGNKKRRNRRNKKRGGRR